MTEELTNEMKTWKLDKLVTVGYHCKYCELTVKLMDCGHTCYLMYIVNFTAKKVASVNESQFSMS